MTTKRNNTTHNEVVVERVLTSDAFLTREIKKAPMKTTGDSLIADLTHLPNDLKITIQGAREHNLKNVDLEFPRNRMVVFTGLSGSGKSSLAFDTLFAEGQRRYVESLSAYARQFLGQMDKPDVDFIEGLSPAVSIDQKTTNRNPRSTVGTITEIYDYLRLLFARTGIPHCPECGALVSAQTPQQMVDTLLKYPERTRFQILAPVVRGRKGEFEDLLELLRGDGYARALIDGEMRQLSDDIKLAKQKKHTIEVVVDRLVVKDVSCLSRDGVQLLDRVTFTARAGEILGIAGIAGSGQRELLEAIAGLQPVTGGEILYEDPKSGETENLRDKTPLQIRELGVRLSFVPEDRLGMGLVSNMDIIDNMMLRSYRRGRSAFLDRQPPRELAERIIEDLGVVTPNATTPVRRLSGGNVQKVLVGREIASAPTVLMAAYPVRGLDINSSYLIYHLLNQQKEKGVAVIYVGEDLDVLLALCDRVIVLSGGRVTGTVDGRTATKEEIGLLMTKAEREGESHVKAE